MFKLMKYDFRRCYLPFGVIILINLLLVILSAFGINGKGNNDLFNSLYGISELVLLIYSSRTIYIDFCTDTNILGLTISQDIVKRFFSKFIVIFFGILLVETSRLLFNLTNPYSSYSGLISFIENYKSYVVYDFVGEIITFLSTLAVAIMVIILVNSILRSKNFVPALSIILIFTLWISSSLFFQNYIYKPYGASNGFKLKDEVKGKVDITYRTYDGPFMYGGGGASAELGATSRSDPYLLGDYSWNGIEYGAGWLILSLGTGIVLLKRKGINY